MKSVNVPNVPKPMLHEKVKLLVVDDREEDLGALCLTLADPAYEIVTARSGREALKLVLAEDFAVILLDVMLPVMDGFEIATMIKQRDRCRHTPILFMTAAGSDMSFIYRAYSVGAVDYLSKPIDADVVKAKVTVFAELFRKDERIRQQAEALREADRRQKEMELADIKRAGERRYHNLADAIPAIVWTARRDGALHYANRCWHQYTGLAKEETKGWGWLQAIHEEDRPHFEAGWREAIDHGVEHASELRLRRGEDGVYRAHLCHVMPERDGVGEVVGWLGTMADCEDLRQAIQAREEFLAVASHELRTPLSSLDLVLHTMRKILLESPDAPFKARLISKVEVAARQSMRLNKLVSALLDVTRIAGAQQMQMEAELCDMGRIVRDVVDRLQDETMRTQTPIVLKGPECVVGRWDPLRIDQVLTNLLANALRYGVGKPIEVAISTAKGSVTITVRDHGEGISAEHLPRLFGRYQRADSKARQGGLGLGLFISRHIVRAHGGELTVMSEPGNGATFTLEMPLEMPQTTGAESAAPASKPARYATPVAGTPAVKIRKNAGVS